MTLIEKHLKSIRALCNKHKVKSLFVFGSVLTEAFKETSDIDFIVDFSGVELYDYADNYFDLKQALERLLQRPVDLLEDQAIKNPYLRQSIDASKRLVYG